MIHIFFRVETRSGGLIGTKSDGVEEFVETIIDQEVTETIIYFLYIYV